MRNLRNEKIFLNITSIQVNNKIIGKEKIPVFILPPHTIHLLLFYIPLLSTSLFNLNPLWKWRKKKIYNFTGRWICKKYKFFFFFISSLMKNEKLSYTGKEEKLFKNVSLLLLLLYNRYTAHTNLATEIWCKQDELSKETEWNECVKRKKSSSIGKFSWAFESASRGLLIDLFSKVFNKSSQIS